MAWFKREQRVDALRQVPEAHRWLLEEVLKHSEFDRESLRLVSSAPPVKDERVERHYGGAVTIEGVLTEVVLRGQDRETEVPVDFIIHGRVDYVPYPPPYDTRLPTANISATLEIVVGEQEVARIRQEGIYIVVEHLDGLPPQHKQRQNAALRHTSRQLRSTISEAAQARAAGPDAGAPVLSSLDTAAAARFESARSELEL